jgi:hypothetical protein
MEILKTKKINNGKVMKIRKRKKELWSQIIGNLSKCSAVNRESEKCNNIHEKAWISSFFHET